MSIIKAAIIALILVLTLWLTGFAVAPPELEGTWLGKTEVPDQGLDEVTMVIVKAKEGFSGTLVDSLGLIAKETAIKEIKLQANELTYHFNLVDEQEVWIKVTVDGDKLTGGWTTAEGDTGAIVFERRK